MGYPTTRRAPRILLRACVYLPTKRGARFSAKAASPSFASSLAKRSPNSSASRSSASGERLSSSFATRSAPGLFAASLPATSSACSRTGSAIAVTSPIRSASSASTWRPVRTSSFATPRPQTRASRCVPPHPGTMPRSISGWPSRALLEDSRHEGHVRAGEDRDADGVRVLLDRGFDDLLGRLVEPGVDHLHAGVAKRAGDDLGTAIVPIEARLGDNNADLPCHRNERNGTPEEPCPGVRHLDMAGIDGSAPRAGGFESGLSVPAIRPCKTPD